MDAAGASSHVVTLPSHQSSAESDGSIESPLKDYSQQADVFLEQHGSQIHEVLGSTNPDLPPTTTFSRQTTLDDSNIQHVELFQKAVRIYQQESQDRKAKGFELKKDTTWTEVLKLAADAEKIYHSKGNKRIRKFGRWITNKSEVALPYLRCIPNDPFYTNILSGGLRIVFEAAARISENRERVLETLLRIPYAIEQAERCVSLVPDDRMLCDRTLQVFLTALAAIEGTVEWLRGTPKSKALNSLFRGTLYTKPLLEKKKALEDALNALEEYLSTLHTQLLVETRKNFESVKTIIGVVEQTGITVDSTTTKTLHHVESIDGMTERTLQHVESIDSKFDASVDQADGRFQFVEAGMRTLTQGQSEARARLEGLADIEKAKKQARKAMQMVLVETMRNAEWRKKQGKYIRSLKKEMRILQATASAMTPDDVLKIIGGSFEHRDFDLRSTLRTCKAADLPDYEMSMKIVQNAMLQNWLLIGESIGLFVEGGDPMASYGRGGSPVSNASSMLIEILDEDPAVPIWFFCGAHDSPRDPLRGPQGIMRSLISQVLSLFDIRLDFISTQRYRQQLESHNLYALCDCFTRLIRRIEPPSVVICVIDEICILENKEWAESCKHVLYKLQALLEDEEVSVVFKLLVTSPNRSRYAAATFPSDCQLKLADLEAETSRHETTERQQVQNGNQRRPQREQRKGTIQRMRRRSHTALWSDISDSEFNSEHEEWSIVAPNGGGRLHTKRRKTADTTVVHRTVEIQTAVLELPLIDRE